jgi:hypothetical protein
MGAQPAKWANWASLAKRPIPAIRQIPQSRSKSSGISYSSASESPQVLTSMVGLIGNTKLPMIQLGSAGYRWIISLEIQAYRRLARVR